MDADFWWVLTMLCLAWYSSITVYVSIRGALDIKNMLARLRALESDRDEADA